MIRLSINLPITYRLDLNLVKRRGNSNISLLPNLEEVSRARKGSKISRFFRHVFEHKKIKKFFGTNIALAFIATTFIPNQPASTNFEAENPIIAATQINTSTEKGTRYPVDNVAVSQNFKFYHPGIDFDGLTGDSIYPIMAGRIEAIDYSKYAYGNAILVNHGNGLTSLYAHLSKILVKQDQEIAITTEIGKMGATGRASGDHLHFELRNGGIPINPYVILPK